MVGVIVPIPVVCSSPKAVATAHEMLTTISEKLISRSNDVHLFPSVSDEIAGECWRIPPWEAERSSRIVGILKALNGLYLVATRISTHVVIVVPEPIIDKT